MTIEYLKANNLILLECISGSKAYGLDTPVSDTDIKGVYFLPKDQFFGLSYLPQISNETNDEVYYELSRYIELLIKNNPNLLELLASPKTCIIKKHPLINILTEKMFVSKLCQETFAGYAITQIRKASGYNKKMVNPVPADKKTIIDFCYVVQGAGSVPLNLWLREKQLSQEECGLTAVSHSKNLYAMFVDDKQDFRGIMSGITANAVSLSPVTKDTELAAYLYFNQDSYSTYCKKYLEYWDWVASRNEKRFAVNMDHQKNYDSKNMMHTIRLLQVAREIALEGKINVYRQNREELLRIKAGHFKYEELTDWAEQLMKETTELFQRSSLPDQPDEMSIEKLLVEMRRELYA